MPWKFIDDYGHLWVRCRPTMIVAFAGQKGGSGKSTAAISCAVDWFARKKRKVLLVDADPQKSALTWAAVASEGGHKAPTVVGMGQGLSKPEQLPSLAEAHDVTLIDCAGRHDTITREALLVSDLVVLPVAPSALDAWALAESIELVTKARQLRPALKARLLVNRLQPRTLVGKSAREALDATGIAILKSALCFRMTYVEGLAAGRGPTTYAAKSPAALEVQALVNELERELRTHEQTEVERTAATATG